MRPVPRTRWLAVLLALGALISAGPAAFAAGEVPARQTLFIGIDTSGSFQRAGYGDALGFLALYIYGHLEGFGGLERPRELFVAPVGGREPDEPKAFRPLHDFAGKTAAQIEADLRAWFPPTDTLTDFNAFFRRVAQIVKERNLLLRPVTILIVTDGVPDVSPGAAPAGSPEAYRAIDLAPLEYLARRVTLRLAYPTPPVAERWRTLVPRQRVRLWTVDDVVMRGWRAQFAPAEEPVAQVRFWKWVRDNVDVRARRRT